MTVTFVIPGMLRRYSEGEAEVALETSGRDVRAALETLFLRHPGLRDRVLDERGEIRRHVNVFLGNESVRDREGLSTALPTNAPASISVFAAVSGGR